VSLLLSAEDRVPASPLLEEVSKLPFWSLREPGVRKSEKKLHGF
jgi:hypothetical protein